MSNVVIVLGTQGAGKSTVLSALSGTVRVVNLGDEMLKLAAIDYGINDRDKLRTLPGYAEKSEEWRRKIISDIANGKENVVLDTHASIKSGNRYTPGFTIKDLDALQGHAKGIIYIDASTAEIIGRRAKDKTRNREQDTATEIDQHRNINLSLASFFSAYLNIPLYILYNNEGSLENTQKKAKEIIEQLFG